MTTRTLAIDIEAVPLTDPPAFNQPEEWRPFAVALSHRPDPTDPPKSVVLIRRDGSDAARRKLLAAVANWIGGHAPHDVLLGYNSENYDLPVLAHHIGEIAESDPDLAKHVRDALDIPHRDLFAELRERQPDDEKWPSLSESLADYSIPVDVATLGDRVVDGGVMPGLGRQVLARDGRLSGTERRALKRYARSDVVPLHSLCDKLDQEREERIAAEADAVAGGGGC